MGVSLKGGGLSDKEGGGGGCIPLGGNICYK